MPDEIISLPIELKTFKPVDIKNSNDRFWIWILANCNVNLLHKPESNNENLWEYETLKKGNLAQLLVRLNLFFLETNDNNN